MTSLTNSLNWKVIERDTSFTDSVYGHWSNLENVHACNNYSQNMHKLQQSGNQKNVTDV